MNGNHASDLDKAKRQIRALLNLGQDDGAAEAEADNALRFARRLMLRHQLSEADLAEAPRDPHEIAAETEYGTADHFCLGAHLSTWESTLSSAVCRLVGTVQVYRTNKKRRGPQGTLAFDRHGQTETASVLVFYGPADDSRDAEGLQREWSLAIAGMARMRYGGCFKGSGRSYAEGFASALLAKANELHREERLRIEAGRAGTLNAHETSAALVLVRQTDLMAAKVERGSEWLRREKGIMLGKSTRRGNSQDPGAYGAGRADGARANFSHSRTRRLSQ